VNCMFITGGTEFFQFHPLCLFFVLICMIIPVLTF